MNFSKWLISGKQLSQSVLGFSNYLFFASLVKYYSLKMNKVEEDIYKFIEMVPSSGIVLDVGSNIGVIGSTIAKMKMQCTIHCFEPIPANANNIRRLRRLLGLRNVVLHEMALGNTSGTIEMIVPRKDKILYEGHSHVVDGETSGSGLRFSVQIDTLDRMFATEQAKIKAIKMDVENYEYHVLLGARQILEKSKPLIYCELWNNDVRYQVIDYLSQLSYDCFVTRNNQLVKVDGPMPNDLNFFFVHR